MRRHLLPLLFLLLAFPAAAVDVSVLGVVIRASDKPEPAVKPVTLSKVLFDPAKSVAQYWSDNTYGNIKLAGTVYPTVLVSAYPLSANRCYFGNLQEAKNLLTQAGISLSKKLLVVVMSGNGNCGSKALGGGNSLTGDGYVVMNGNVAMGYVAHEAGHSFGLAHASSIRQTSTTRWSVNPYGYNIDIMGEGNFMGSSNVVHKAFLGLLSGRIQQHTAPAGESVTYTIKPLESPDGMVAIRIGGQAAPGSWQTDAATWIEYRQPIGLDAALASKESRLMMTRGALVMRTGYIPNTGSCFPCLIDTKPSSSGVSDAAVLPGESYIEAGHKIETISATPEALTIQVTKQ